MRGSPSAGPAGLQADQRDVHAAVPAEVPLDVLFDGRRVWSVVASSDDVTPAGVAVLAWPEPLRRFLHGRTQIEICEHASGRCLARGEVQFGDGDERVAVVDSAGRALAMHKWGKLGHVFEDVTDDDKSVYLDQVDEVLQLLADDCGVPAFLSYGTLLGAVRNGRLIGHDVDVDLGYLSAHSAPVDVIRESFAIERALAARTGWRISRANGGFLQLFPPQRDGARRNIDVFSCFCTDTGGLYQINDIGTRGDRSVIVPLTSVLLEGRQFPAPARPEVLLEAAYGPSWRVPDPTFRYSGTPTRRRMRMWVGGLREARDTWSRFYNAHLAEIPLEPSLFATWVQDQLGDEWVVDVGCGNGRDVLFFAASGHPALGLDVVPSAYRPAQAQARRQSSPAEFRPLNLSSLRDTLQMGALLARRPGPRAVTARFLLHNLDRAARDNFWRLCSMALSSGGRCYVEFRTPADKTRPTHFPTARARGLAPRAVVREAERHGAVVVERRVGRRMAPFHEEDPIVCRLVLEWPGTR